MQHSLLRLSFYFLCLFIVSDAAIKFRFISELDKILQIIRVSLYLHHQISRILPAKQSIKHIRRLSKAITGALYPVLSDHCGSVVL